LDYSICKTVYLTLRTLTCNSIVIDGTNFNVILTELQTTLDKTAKINSANTFTGLQTINGDLKADYVLVKNTTPTLTTHLTFKLYVDTSLNTKQIILSRSSNVSINSLIVSNDTFSSGSIVPGQISCISLLINGVNIDTSLNEKQNTLDPTSVLSVNKVSTLGDITAGGNLSFFDNTIGSRNVKTEFSATNSAINLKQDKINFLTNLTCATLDCSNLNIGGESIYTKIANSTGAITQAD